MSEMINPIIDYKDWLEAFVVHTDPPFKLGSEESERYGLKASDPGAKMDGGKVMASLLQDFNKALLAVAEVSTVGAKKYSRGGWTQVEDGYNRYSDAMLRHYFADGLFDNGAGGTGLLHDAQVAWNALARLQFRLEGKV